MNSYSLSSQFNVDISSSNAFSFHLFKDDQCQYESSQNYSLSYISMTECKKKLIECNPSLSSEEIMFIKVDLPEPETPMIATISPATIVKSTFFRTVRV